MPSRGYPIRALGAQGERLTAPDGLGTPGPVVSPQTLPLVLASASPRRSDLLRRAGVAFEVMPARIDETPHAGEEPAAFAERLARAKALVVARRIGGAPRRVVLGADTIVVIDGDILGKPRDPEHALELLRLLVGRTHGVVTAVALAASDTLAVRSERVESRVEMRHADDGELRDYVGCGESLDKAGAYAVQGEGRRFVAAIHGSETNVMGLPLSETLRLLRSFGIEAAGA